MSNRRKLKPAGKREPWNKGLAMTTRPSVSTVRRRLEGCVEEGWAERKGVGHTGKPGRPPVLYGLTEEAAKLAAEEPPRPPLHIVMEQHRRQVNAGKRRGAQLKQRLHEAGRQLELAKRGADRAKARLDELTDLAEMLMDASTALDRAGYDPSVLLPEELDALEEYGCVAKDGDRLYFTGGWVRTYCGIRGGDARLISEPAPTAAG